MRVQPKIFRVGFVSLILMLACVVANAYTIVMRDGRRIEIPSRFIVTPHTLTYEVAEGVQVTLNLKTIDIDATEKANNEPAGALMRRTQVAAPVTRPAMAAVRTITNRDLEVTAKRRKQSEIAYDKRVQELGLPSVTESRERAAVESETIGRELQQSVASEREREAYWRSRATEMRTEIAALDAEIAYVRGRIEEMPVVNWSGGFTSVSTVVPFISFGGFGGRGLGAFGGRGHFPSARGHRASVYSAPRGVGPQLSGRFGVGRGSTRARVFINPRHSGFGQFNRGRFGHGGGIGGIAPFGVWPSAIASSYPGYDNSYERSELITRFNDLAAERAGLRARWRELEDEARRAGAMPGWLRE